MTSRADDLFARVAAGEDGDAANELLAEFYGYPVERLRELIRSRDPEVAKTGAFLASELGAKARPLLSDMPVMLDHPEPWVRVGGLDVIFASARPDDGALVASALALVRDRNNGEAREFGTEIDAALRSEDGLTRLFGAIAAARVADRRDDLLAAAAASPDDDVRSFAVEVLEERAFARARE